MNAADQIAGQLVAERMAILRDAPRLVAKAVNKGWARFPVPPIAVVSPAVPASTGGQAPEIPLADLQKWVAFRGLNCRQAAENLGFGYREFTEAMRGERTLRGRLPR